MKTFHIAQVNLGRIRAELDDPIMAGFVNRLEEINALADGSPGFVWRLQEPVGNATYLRPYDDERTLMNMSVWESVETLRHFVFNTAHVELLRQRQAWFERFEGAYTALCGFRRGIFRGSTRRRSGWRIWRRMGRRSLRLRFSRRFCRMRRFSGVSTGPRSGRAQRFERQ